jgi:hypothetical protein
LCINGIDFNLEYLRHTDDGFNSRNYREIVYVKYNEDIMIKAPVDTSKEKEALECAKQVLEFMQNGGKIEICEPDPRLNGKVYKDLNVGYKVTKFN